MSKHPMIGHIAMVRTDKSDIPVFLRGWIGTILGARKTSNGLIVDVEFDRKSSGDLEAGDLLLLRPAAFIKQSLKERGATLTKAQTGEIGKIIALIELGEEQAAVDLALKHKLYYQICLIDGAAWLQLHRQQQRKGSRKHL